MEKISGREPELTVGLDLGDRFSRLCGLDRVGEVVEEGRLATTEAALRRRFGGAERCRVVVEVGTHSLWVSRLLRDLGHEVLVANPRQLRLIYRNDRKSDRVDAEYLARVGADCSGRAGRTPTCTGPKSGPLRVRMEAWCRVSGSTAPTWALR